MSEITEWCRDIASWRGRKGFYTPDSIIGQQKADLMLGKLMLVVSEIAEASEAVRKADVKNFIEELADATIRIFDICGTMGIDLSSALRDKMEVNEGRPIRHGKQTTL